MLKDRGMLYEGLHVTKSVKDTELLMISSQEQYDELVKMAQDIVNNVHAIFGESQLPQEVLLSMEKTKRVIERTKQMEASVKRLEIEFEILKFRAANAPGVVSK